MIDTPSILHLFVVICLGVLSGVITGLIPSLHPNNLIAIILLNVSLFLSIFNLEQLIVYITALSISHSFTSFLASIIFGVPEEDTVLSVLPGHRLMLNGEGYKAVFLTVIGGLLVVLMSLATLPILLMFLKDVYRQTLKFLPFVIFLVLSYFILIQNNKFKAFLITIFAGMLGYLVLNLYTIPSYSRLAAMFAGLFGMAIIIDSINTNVKLPEQNFAVKEEKLYVKDALLGFLATLMIMLFPSLSPSQSIVIIQSLFKMQSIEGFLVALGSLTTADALLSIVALYILGNPRSGASVAIERLIGEIDFSMFLFILSVILVSVSLSALVTLSISKFLLKGMMKVDYKKINVAILIFIVGLIAVTSGIYGLLILITSTSLGMVCLKWNVDRNLLMASLMIPTAISFLI